MPPSYAIFLGCKLLFNFSYGDKTMCQCVNTFKVCRSSHYIPKMCALIFFLHEWLSAHCAGYYAVRFCFNCMIGQVLTFWVVLLLSDRSGHWVALRASQTFIFLCNAPKIIHLKRNKREAIMPLAA